METPGQSADCPDQTVKPYVHPKTRTMRDSFKDAWSGLSLVYLTQRNLRVHVFLASLVGGVCLVLGLERNEVLMVLLAVASVLVAEMVNSLTETFTDMMRPEYSVQAKITKDIAAGGVLLAAVFSVVIGAVAFYPSLLDLPRRLSDFKKWRLVPFLVYTVLVLVPSFGGLFLWKEK